MHEISGVKICDLASCIVLYSHLHSWPRDENLVSDVMGLGFNQSFSPHLVEDPVTWFQLAGELLVQTFWLESCY